MKFAAIATFFVFVFAALITYAVCLLVLIEISGV